MKRPFIIRVLAIATLISCDHRSTSTGNPLVSLKINGSSQSATVASFQFWRKLMGTLIPEAVAAPTSIVDSTGRTVILTNFWTTVGEVEFKRQETTETGETDGDSIEFQGPYTTNFLETQVNAIGSAEVSLSEIRRIKVKLIRTSTLPATAPAALTNKSIFISGTVGGIALTYSSSDEAVIEVAGPNPVTVSDQASLLLQLQVANLFKRVNLSGISASTDISESNRVPTVNPCPAIDASATDLYTCFRKGLASEANFGRDNGNNELDSNDDTVK